MALPPFNKSRFPTIAVINYAKTPLGFDLEKGIATAQKAYDRDFVPIWGFPSKLYICKDKKPKPGEWQIGFFDDADEADALGYHEVNKDGIPVSKVFVKTTLKAGESVLQTFDHEWKEMALDPAVNLWARDDRTGKKYALEAADACESDTGYVVDNMLLSNFITPEFLEYFRKNKSVRFDFLGNIAAPFGMTPGGYQIVEDENGKSASIFGSQEKALRFFAEDRRGHRNEVGRNQGRPFNGLIPGSPMEEAFFQRASRE